MAITADRRPRTTWPLFVEAAGDFLAPMWAYDECFDRSFAPLVRAVAFYDMFNARVSNGGATNYFTYGSDVVDFDRAPEIVAVHPELQDVAALMREGYDNKAFVAEMAAENSKAVSSDAIAEKHRSFDHTLSDRFFSISDEARRRVERAILTDPSVYMEIAPLPGVSGRGIEIIEAEGELGVWRLRFEDGFPVGPNLVETNRGVAVTRFSSDHLHVDFEVPGYTREWRDFTTGLRSSREFSGGRFSAIRNYRGWITAHGLNEQFDIDGAPQFTRVELPRVSIAHYRRSDARSPYVVSRIGSNSSERYEARYFPSGQLNSEFRAVIDDRGLRHRYLASFDEAGNDLAPDGSGTLRELYLAEDGPRWREGTLRSGYLYGQVHLRETSGAVVHTEIWENGRMSKELGD